jgi:hypothetical protein
MDLEQVSKAVDCRVLKKLPFQVMPHCYKREYHPDTQ